MRGTVIAARQIRTPAFTLVELLVVFGLLAVIAAILLPVFARVRALSVKTTCLSHERQISAACALYLQDYDERFPDLRSDSMSARFESDPPYWHDHFCLCLHLTPDQPCYLLLLHPYLTTNQAAFCPTDVDRASGGRTTTSYEYKLWLARGHSLADVPKPASLALLWEQWAYHEGDGHLSEYDRRSAMNVAFVDGHTAWRRLSDSMTARFTGGPDLHGLFAESNPSDPHFAMDFER